MPSFLAIFLFWFSIPILGLAKSFPTPKNIIYIMADDLGIEGLSCYGGADYQTPHLDQLATEGIRFTHAYSQPLCSPTRLEIMTGRDNHRNWKYFGILPPEEKTFGHFMKDAGYRTCIAGKWQLQSYDPPDFPNADQRRGTGMHPKDSGFQEYSLFHSLHTEDKGSRYADPTYLRNGKLIKNVVGKYGEDLSVDFMLDFLSRHRNEKNFIYYPMALPHWPVNPTPHSADWADPDKRLLEDIKYFPEMVAYMDTLVGRIVAGVEKLGLRDDTLIIFYSDNGTSQSVISTLHGEKVQGGKATPRQTGIRVPLIAHWPGKIQPAVRNDLIEASDFLITFSDLAGKKLPSDWQHDGVSFAPQLFGDHGTPREWAFFWYDPRPGWDKEKFSRAIFALDHHYKLFSDGRLYAIDGLGYKEKLLSSKTLSQQAKAARTKLKKAIASQMSGPISPNAAIMVDTYGNLLPKK